jgi:hypothetical protein
VGALARQRHYQRLLTGLALRQSLLEIIAARTFLRQCPGSGLVSQI